MIRIRKSDERGLGRESWLESRHTFSFSTYQDPRHMGFRQLRVINEDRVAAGGGFPLHAHRDMEIFSFVISGALEHQDDLGNRERIGPGELQMFSAGTGIHHSEYNPSPSEEVHFFQVWIFPERDGLPPRYEKKSFDLDRPGLQLIASPQGEEGSALIHQNVRVYFGNLPAGEETQVILAPGLHLWLQLVDGHLSLNDENLDAGDGAAVSEEGVLRLRSQDLARFFLFDLS
ncbi:pirin family protein [Geoalkalibacter halelectricus]|uniref:Pirin family protein n=1 Tax=Geoalkalibacter halelectricus TaxID=2847045 RepID=A0ABY5ZPM1_9BACT|nr:pirin family protein [Geoalkalibacter halelectricus]MDO3376882.1 pirin family protein [Geoalkalibacter halelectricus]UWZ81107.1 pirin family protein [Geoalkalibacter halelectricus]